MVKICQIFSEVSAPQVQIESRQCLADLYTSVLTKSHSHSDQFVFSILVSNMSSFGVV